MVRLVFASTPVELYTQVIDARQAIINMVAGKDDRLLVVVGPLDADASALHDLAEQLASIASTLSSELVIVLRADAAMRLATADQVNKGIRRARELLLELNSLGVPTAIAILLWSHREKIKSRHDRNGGPELKAISFFFR